MDSERSDVSTYSIIQNYRSQNLRGSLFECFKNNNILVDKRSRASTSSVADSYSGLVGLDKSRSKLSSRVPLVQICPSQIIVSQLPLQDNKHHQSKAQCNIACTQTCPELQFKSTEETQTQTIPESALQIVVHNRVQNIQRVMQLEQQVFILQEKYRLETVSYTRLEQDCQKLRRTNREYVQQLLSHPLKGTMLNTEEIRADVFKKFQQFVEDCEKKYDFLTQTIQLMNNEMDKLVYKVQIACLKNSTGTNECQLLKNKLSKYELQNQRLISQLYLKSEQTYKYWSCLKDLSKLLEKTTIWNKVYNYYKDIDYKHDMYN